ncbi:MAG: FKBP-type peptidyl-prolyl cis-trans isomerase [Bacteroidales bacterium]
MRYFKLVIFIALLSCCTKEDRQVQIAQQIKDIDTYVQNAVTAGKRIVVNRGSTRLVISEGSGDSLMVGDSIFFDFAGYIFQSGLGSMFDTNVDSIAEAAGINIYNRGFDYGKGVVGKGMLINGLDRGLLGVKSGEHSYIVFPTDLGFNNKDIGLVPKMSPLIYEVWIKEIKKN